ENLLFAVGGIELTAPLARSFPRPVERPCTAATLLAANRIGARETLGDLQTLVRWIAASDHAAAGSLVFFQGHATSVPAGVVVVAARPVTVTAGCCVVTADPRRWFVEAVDHLFPGPVPEISETAVVAASARIAANVSIGPFSVIGEDVEI